MLRLASIVLSLFLLAAASFASPIASNLSTTDLTVALTEFDDVAFNAVARWESSGTANFKLRIAPEGSGTGAPGAVVGENGITWSSQSPQDFSLSYDGSKVVFTITDNGVDYTLENDNPLVGGSVDSLLLAVRSIRSDSSAAVSDLKVDGASLNIASLAVSGNVGRSFLLVSGITTNFTLTGKIALIRPAGGTGAEHPSFQVFAGTAPADVPEPSTVVLLSMGMLGLFVAARRRSVV